MANPETLKSELACKIVIVVGAWSQNSYASGEQGDAVSTPSGPITGTLLHANYIEALLDSRTFKPLSCLSKTSLGIVLSGIVAVILALRFSFGFKLLAVLILLGGFTLALTYFLWQNLGVLFDFCIPVGLLLGHCLVERVLRK